MPISWQARMTRRAISPRLAIRIFLNKRYLWRSSEDWVLRTGSARPSVRGPGTELSGFDDEQRLSVFDRLGVFHHHLGDPARHFGLDLVHQFHGFDDAHGLAYFHSVTFLDEGLRVRGGGRVKSPHHGG